MVNFSNAFNSNFLPSSKLVPFSSSKIGASFCFSNSVCHSISCSVNILSLVVFKRGSSLS